MTVLPRLIDTIDFSNYRCFRDSQQLQLGRLTLVYGENNAGKSALVRLPALLADTQQQDACGLNSTSELLRGASPRDVQWRGPVAAGESPDTTIKLGLKGGASWSWLLEWKPVGRRLDVSIVGIEFEGTSLTEHIPRSTTGMLPDAPPPALTAHVQDLTSLWDRTCWLGTARLGPSSVGVPVGRTGRLWGDGAMAEAEVLNSKPLREAVSKFYENHVRRAIQAEPRGIDAEALALQPVTAASHSVSFAASGSGLEHIFPIVTAAERLRSEGGLLIVEEPEAHLHPRLQRALAEHLVAVTIANPKTQILMETHSEVFLLAALTAAMPGDSSSSTDVAIYWTETSDDGSATVERIPLDEAGRPKTPRLEHAYDTMGVMRRDLLRKRRAHAG